MGLAPNNILLVSPLDFFRLLGGPKLNLHSHAFKNKWECHFNRYICIPYLSLTKHFFNFKHIMKYPAKLLCLLLPLTISKCLGTNKLPAPKAKNARKATKRYRKKKNTNKVLLIAGGAVATVAIIVCYNMVSKPPYIIEGLKAIKDGGKGDLFSGEKFEKPARDLLLQIKDQVTFEKVRPLVINALMEGNFDITKKKEDETYGKYWVNQVEHGLIDGGIISAKSAIILDVLLTLLEEVVGKEQAKKMVNDPGIGGTVLHNLISRCREQKDPKESKGTGLNTLPHINVVLAHGADPKLKVKINGEDAIQQAEGNDPSIIIEESSNDEEKWIAKFKEEDDN